MPGFPGILLTYVPLWSGVAVAMVSSCCFIGWALAVNGAVTRRERRPVRCCPLCAGTAVVEADVVSLGGLHTQIEVRCGQCGAWRRVVTTHWQVRRHELELLRDRRIIEVGLRQMQRDRDGVFMSALRNEIVGVDDFLAWPLR